MATDRTTTATALLRIAGVPCAAWTSAGDPGLFERVAHHARAADERAARARDLAERLGAHVVPHPGLADTDRGAVLALRRRLHAGHAPRAADLALLDRLPGHTATAGLAADARALAHDAERAGAERTALVQQVTDGQQQAAVRVWELARTHPVLRDLLASAAPGLLADVERRLAAGESWSGKPLRKRAAYLWRVIGRAAAKTTPRGWAGQLATAPVLTEAPGTLLIAPGTTLGALAATGTENVHLVRSRPPGPPDLRTADPGTLLAPAPLHFTQPPSSLRAYVVDPREPTRLRHVALRRTRALDAVLTVLADGPCPLGEVEKTLLGPAAPPGGAPAPDAAVLRGFLQHLHTMGLLQVCAAPRLRHTAWTPPTEVAAAGTPPRPLTPADGTADGWFLDSYRALDAPVPARAAERVRQGLRVAARIAALRDAGTPAAREAPELAAITEQPRPVSEILAALLPAGGDAPRPGPVAHRPHEAWPAPADPDCGYARLLAHLAAHTGPGPADVDHALLDALGAPPADDALPPWPLDCLLRPLPDGDTGPLAVLETASAAGVLDARFADGLRALYGGHPNADAHRAFLAAVERHSGVRFVELLVPPLAERAANAVRRPVVTNWWTGDPDPTPYHGPSGTGARYLPLDRITLRRSGGRIVAEADGHRVVPVHHATRSPLPPYDVLVRVLLAAGHPAAATLLRLDGLDGALHGHPRLPRVTAAGELVLAPATWRLERARLWRPADDPYDKVRALAALRRDTGLPRHVFVRTAAGAKPVPVDLDALPALPVVDRLRAQQPGTDLLVEEMLPAPAGLPLRDPLHGGAAVAAQVLLRLPHDTGEALDRLAARAAAALPGGAASPDVPDTPPAACGRTAGAAIAH
ncbi:lantibiotic dehydratase [Streptomyces sp. WAC05374]|uniref:lantibiotic dehydratase n=1 Tax=Streptomyces sp. WAC05374 TaxID=2487420 RepID=UPI000F874265|nr:lantibiotic dehydratase [Streptomyces sp. WAC05374]RST13628.1 lantibiotic dehydratase [Streptomyces sp. WAC05374]TDF50496.1 lantibiotic dehydratase [Streptomyces sp. WAC05374]TDF51864.1 lantibiotic dehydratase [Streptomyces sp. WAC05374]TDF60750.1 lantibiotic dehydratase [Streptomyces sp. WAC05374]